MPWFKVDDNLAFHSKVLAAGNDAMGLWVRAGSWSAQQLTDGVIPKHLIAVLGTPSQARRLVLAGLWEDQQQAFLFHDWAERQPSREDVEAKREAARERMRQVRASRAQPVRANDDGTDVEPGENFGERSPNPDPTRPDPTLLPTEEGHEKTSSSRGRAKRSPATRLPADFAVSQEMQAWASQEAPNAGPRDHDQFVDYWTAKPGAAGRKADWVATWRNWMRKASDERGDGSAALRGRGPGPRPGPDERAAGVAALARQMQQAADAREATIHHLPLGGAR